MSTAIPTPIDTRTVRPLGRADGVFFVGRPGWLTDGVLADLRAESRAMRPGASQFNVQHYADVGPVARALCGSSEMLEFVGEHAAPARHSGEANYRYYDIPQSHMPPHVDTEAFWFNVTIMLEHSFGEQRRSVMLLFPHGPDPVTLVLEPGEVILFRAKDLVHARTPIADDNQEFAANLGIGFTPLVPLEDPGFWRPGGAGSQT
jgi:hypothetical protein